DLAQKPADAQIKANETTIKGLDKQADAIEKDAVARIKVNNLTLKGLTDQITGIQKAADAQRNVNDLELEGLQVRKDALQEAIDASKQWKDVLDDINAQINDLLLGPEAPLNPMQQLEIARKAYEDALSTATTPEGIKAAQS